MPLIPHTCYAPKRPLSKFGGAQWPLKMIFASYFKVWRFGAIHKLCKCASLRWSFGWRWLYREGPRRPAPWPGRSASPAPPSPSCRTPSGGAPAPPGCRACPQTPGRGPRTAHWGSPRTPFVPHLAHQRGRERREMPKWGPGRRLSMSSGGMTKMALGLSLVRYPEAGMALTQKLGLGLCNGASNKIAWWFAKACLYEGHFVYFLIKKKDRERERKTLIKLMKNEIHKKKVNFNFSKLKKWVNFFSFYIFWTLWHYFASIQSNVIV